MPIEENGWTLIKPAKKDEDLEVVAVENDEDDEGFFEPNLEDDQQDDEDDDSDDEVVHSQNDLDNDDDDGDDDEEEEQKPRKKDNNNKKHRRGDRAQRRIQALVAEKKALEEEVRKAREESTEAKNTASSERKRAVEVAKTSLETKLEILEANLTKATDDGDTAQILRISRELSGTESSLKELKSIKMPDPVAVQPKPKTEQKQPSREDLLATLPEAGQDWIEDNPKVWTDPKFRTKAMGYSQILEAEGYDPQLQEYWDELEKKMSGKGGNPVNKNTPRKRDKRRTPTVGGSSRVTRSSNNKVTVKLTHDQINLAKRLGITPDEYALRVVEHEENTNSKNGYTTINTGRRV